MFVSTYQLSVHELPLHKTVNKIAEHDKRLWIRTVVITRIGLLTVHVRLDWVCLTGPISLCLDLHACIGL